MFANAAVSAHELNRKPAGRSIAAGKSIAQPLRGPGNALGIPCVQQEPGRLGEAETKNRDWMNDPVYVRRSVKNGESIYRCDDQFSSIYAIRRGFFKTVIALPDGREQVTGFHMAGEILGLEGVGPGVHTCNAVALEISVVNVIPYSILDQPGDDMHGHQRQIYNAMSQAIAHDRGILRLLGTMCAEERLAVFLLNLSRRVAARGHSPLVLDLRMQREEIGSYLGLEIETVRRVFSRFQDEGLISVEQQTRTQVFDNAGPQCGFHIFEFKEQIHLLDIPGLMRWVAQIKP